MKNKCLKKGNKSKVQQIQQRSETQGITATGDNKLTQTQGLNRQGHNQTQVEQMLIQKGRQKEKRQ